MGLLFMIVVGAILGWLAAIVLKIEAPRGILLNIAAGVAGALVVIAAFNVFWREQLR